MAQDLAFCEPTPATASARAAPEVVGTTPPSRQAARAMAAAAIAKAVDGHTKVALAHTKPAGRETERGAKKAVSSVKRGFNNPSGAGAPVQRRESALRASDTKLRHVYTTNPLANQKAVAFGRSNVHRTDPSVGFSSAQPPPTMHDPAAASHGGVRALLLKDLRRELRARGASPAGGVDVLRDRLTKELEKPDAVPLAVTHGAVNVVTEVSAGGGGESEALARSREWMRPARPTTAPGVTESHFELEHASTPMKESASPMASFGRKGGMQSPGGDARPGARKLNVFTMHPSATHDSPTGAWGHDDVVPAGSSGNEVYTSNDRPGQEGRLRRRGSTHVGHDILMGEMQRASGLRGGGCIFDVSETDRTRRRQDYVQLVASKEKKVADTSGRGGYMHRSQIVFSDAGDAPPEPMSREASDYHRITMRQKQGVGFALLRGGYSGEVKAPAGDAARRPQSARPATPAWRDPGPLGESRVVSQVMFG